MQAEEGTDCGLYGTACLEAGTEVSTSRGCYLHVFHVCVVICA